MSASLKDRVVIVTGAGSGIGLAMAHEFAGHGSKIVLVDISEERIVNAAKEIQAKNDVEVLALKADAAQPQDILHVIETAVGRFKRIHVLCNNAGISDRQRPLLETPPEVWNRLLEINLTGPYHFCRFIVPHMIEQGGGAIVNTLSISAALGGRGGFAYTVSKHGLLGLTRSIAVAYGEQKIRCNGISPGSVITNISSGELGGDASPAAKALREKGLATRPSRTLPDQIAPAATFLASDDARYINGQNLIVDDGWTAY